VSEIAEHWIDDEWVESDTASEDGSWTAQTEPGAEPSRSDLGQHAQ
jgi:hypothetical protein